MPEPIEVKEPKPPTLPPPVEYPEYFPGFGREFEQLGVEYYKAQTRLAEAERVRAQVEQLGTRHPLSRVLGFKPPEGFMVPAGGGLVRIEDYERQLEQARQEFDLALQGFKATEWRREVMITLPNYLSIPDYKLQSPEDILQYVPLDSMRDEDTVWLASTFDRLKHLSNVLPEGWDGDAIEAQTKILDEILTAPKLELRAVHNLTVEEIAKSFAFGVAELPQGMTEEQVRGMLSQMELQDEEMKTAKDWLSMRATNWRVETTRLNLIRAGTVLAEAPELTPLEFGKLLFTQPMMATVELLDKYFSLLPRPLYAAATIGVHKLIKTPEDTAAARLEESYNFYLSMGETSWSAYAKAFNDWEAPWWLKLGGEIFFDPVSYIGLGFATAVGFKLGSGLSKIGLRQLGTRIGPWVGAVEGGYVAGADAIFKLGVKGVLSPIKGAFWLTGAGYQIPRTFTMMARNFARDSYMKLSSTLQKTFPEVRNMKGLTAKDAIETSTNAIDQAIARPMEGWDVAVRAGAPMLEFGYIDEAAALRFAKDIVEEVTFDTPRLARLNNEVLNMFSGQGERITAGKIIADLGQEATEDLVNKMAAKLAAFRQKVADTAKASLKGDTAVDVLMGNFNRLESIRYANLQSPLTKYMNQAGRSASWHSRVADRVLYSSALVALERRLVMPIARWNLLFTNFGPYNFLENMQRSFLGGAEVLYPRSYSGVAETNRLFKGLANAPYELQMFERGEARLAQALIDPKTGRTAIFQGGKVPFITKQVVIPEKVPFLGGKTVGAKINIAGKDHYLASFQDGYDMWAHFNSMQVAYDYQVHYMKALTEVAPDDMGRLTGILAKRRGELDNIAATHPKDARDIERVLMQDATVGPEAVRMHSKLDVLEFERRQVSKDLGKTFDKCTDVRMGTKQGIRDEVLDGSIFTDIDGRIAAWTERERELSLVSLKNQIKVLTDEADAFLANPPRNLDEFLGDMQNISSMVEGTGERIHDYRKLTELRKAKLLPGEMDDFEVGSAKLLAEFMETSEEQLTKIMNRLVKNAGSVSIEGLEFRAYKEFFSSLTPATQEALQPVDRFVNLYSRLAREGLEFPNNLVDELWDLTQMTQIEFRSLGGHSSQVALIDTAISNPTRANKVIAIDSVASAAHDRGSLLPTLLADYQALSKELGVSPGRVGYEQIVEDMGVAVETTLRELSEGIGKGTPVLSEVQLARLTDLDSISRLELENILSTRNKIAEIESIIPRTPKKARNNRFWTQQRAQKATIWDEFDGNARRFKSLRLRSSRNFLNSVDKSVYVPDFVPEVVTELTPNHLAYLFGATGDDLYRGLTRVQHHITIRPREDFILHTVEQADAYAAKLGKSAADIGFTDDAIGEVYDQLWHNLGVEPTILTPDSPTVMQLEEIRQEVTRLHAANKIPESDVVKWRQYINGVADDVAGTPMYKAVPEPLPSGVTAKGVVRDLTDEQAESLLSQGYYFRGIGEAEGRRFGQVGQFFTKEYDAARDLFGPNVLIAKLGYSNPLRAVDEPAAARALGISDAFERLGGEGAWEAEELLSRTAIGAGYDAVDMDYWVISLADEIIQPFTGAPTTRWEASKESAMTKARDMHALAYPTYDDANIIDESMRAIFPFWNYELFRWRWIPRTAMRTPGTMTGVAKYVENTDQGYLPIPGTDLQINMLRGSVWMGGLRSFYLRDFPEYYDVMPGMEFIDYIGRAGFFPGIHVMLPIVAFGAATGKPEIGQLAPAWVRTGLSALRALSPQHIGAVLEHIYPDRFRDYMTMLTLGEEGYDADEIWRKKQTGEKLTPEEDKLWLNATNRVDGVKGILMQQTGLFRIRPQEFTEIRREMRLAIEEATGVPVSVQDQIDRQYPVTGKRFSDYYKLDVMQQKLLYEWDTYRRWQGVTTPLYPSSWQLLDVKTRDYYEDLEKVYNEARTVGVYEDDKLIRPSMVEMNRQWVEGEIGPDQWMGFRSDLVGSLAEAVRVLGESPAYKDVPKTFEERAKMLEERNIPTPTQTPDQELLYYYYELSPEYKWNWESQRMERDFDTYYAYIDILLESLDAPHRERLLQRIQSDWTPMEKLYWQVSREYMRPYRNLREIVLREYDPEQIQQIRRYEVAPAAEREQLQEIIGPDGLKLISGYQKRLREARQRLRILDPTTDAWLNFFGTTTSLISTEAKSIYEDLREKYLVESMIK